MATRQAAGRPQQTRSSANQPAGRSANSRSQRTNGGSARTSNTKAASAQAPRLVARIGSLELDIPRSIGYFGGIGVAVTAGLIDPPLGLFIAAIPFIKMADLPGLPSMPRFLAQIFEGVAKPVGGDSEGTIRITTEKGSSDSPVSSDSQG